jgi:glutamine synthetase
MFLLKLEGRMISYIRFCAAIIPGPGQLEIVLRYLNDPVQLADAVLMTRETIRSVARAHSLKALFIPKYDLMQAGNGLHVHMSIRDQTTGLPIFSNGSAASQGLSSRGSAFVEGILRHLPALMGVTMPTTNSFRRVGAGCWTGSAVGWAVEDKEAGIRVCSDLVTQEWTNVEFKLCDSSCNLYMGLAGILACGLHGIAQELTLQPPLSADAGNHVEPLPASLLEALEFLEKDELLNLTLGPSLMKGHLALRRNEAERADKLALKDEVKEWLARA